MGFASLIENVRLRYEEAAAYGGAPIGGPMADCARPLSPTYSPTTPVSATLISFLSQLRAIYMEIGQNVIEGLRSQNWNYIADRMDKLRQRLELFKLQVLGKPRDEKYQYADELERERDFLITAKQRMLGSLDGPFARVQSLVAIIEIQHGKEHFPPLHQSDVDLCKIAKRDCRQWIRLRKEAEEWIAILEKRALEMEDSIFMDVADSITRIEDKDQCLKRRKAKKASERGGGNRY